MTEKSPKRGSGQDRQGSWRADPGAASPEDQAHDGIGNEPSRPGKRAERSAARRNAILVAAVDEFTERGFAFARMEDIAKRAGVGKGTIYLHFQDKETLFKDLVTTLIGPVIANIESVAEADLPARRVIENLFLRFTDLQGSGRREVVRMVMTEGPRFPQLAEFYYREVVSRGLAVIRAVLERAQARGEVRLDRLGEFPQLVMAPALVGLIWTSLFGRVAPLDMAEMLRVHLDHLFGPDETQP